MIEILDTIHHCIPCQINASPTNNNVLERSVFGGDVLTNERAYQAQLDMINGT